VENNKNCSVEGCTNTRGKQQKLLGRRMHQHPYPDVRLALHAGIQAFGALERFERGEGFRVRSNRRREGSVRLSRAVVVVVVVFSPTDDDDQDFSQSQPAAPPKSLIYQYARLPWLPFGPFLSVFN
jgi:hypothetical protein